MAGTSQAIVIIHGMGEHRPMATLRGFMAGVFRREDRIESLPDPLSDSFELRRFQVPRTPERPRTFVYEYYWTHLMRGNTWAHLKALVRRFLFRSPMRLPSSLRIAWLLVWLVTAAAGFGAWFLTAKAGLGLGDLNDLGGLRKTWRAVVEIEGWQEPAAVAGLVLLAAVLRVMPMLLAYVGDVARYCSPTPDNVAVRQAIRAGAVTLLERLQERHDRVIVVGHSLGSIVGLDALRFVWGRTYATHDARADFPQVALEEVERLGAALDASSPAESVDEFRAAQRRLWQERIVVGSPWRVSDFVSVGSPLCLATFILADDEDDWARLQREHEAPTCPPVKAGSDADGEGEGCAYDPDPEDSGDGHLVRRLHNAALFACVRWTNIWFPARGNFFGDWFGGPLRHLFGHGVRDHKALAGPGRLLPGLAHVRYFTPAPGDGPPQKESSLALLLDALELDSEEWVGETVRRCARRAKAAEPVG